MPQHLHLRILSCSRARGKVEENGNKLASLFNGCPYGHQSARVHARSSASSQAGYRKQTRIGKTTRSRSEKSRRTSVLQDTMLKTSQTKQSGLTVVCDTKIGSHMKRNGCSFPRYVQCTLIWRVCMLLHSAAVDVHNRGSLSSTQPC